MAVYETAEAVGSVLQIPMSEEEASSTIAGYVGRDWNKALSDRRGHPARVSPAGNSEDEFAYAHVASGCALDVARERNGGLTESDEQTLRAAWFTLWVNAQGAPRWEN